MQARATIHSSVRTGSISMPAYRNERLTGDFRSRGSDHDWNSPLVQDDVADLHETGLERFSCGVQLGLECAR